VATGPDGDGRNVGAPPFHFRFRAAGQASTSFSLSASEADWVEGGWDLDHSVVFARELRRLGIDLIDCSSGALTPTACIPGGKGFQVPFARRIRHESQMTGAVGLITEAAHANEIITNDDADLCSSPENCCASPTGRTIRTGRRAQMADPVRICRQATRPVTVGPPPERSGRVLTTRGRRWTRN
jgi:2,4-dienoyl-CoA reductase-like NADH-dependent reductase (Old Yellow Enzyme family)